MNCPYILGNSIVPNCAYNEAEYHKMILPHKSFMRFIINCPFFIALYDRFCKILRAELLCHRKINKNDFRKNFRWGGTYDLPDDFRAALVSDANALKTWEDITPLARNEWICWIESAKKPETRQKRILWGCENLGDGKRRPCCWPGCPHR